MNRQPKVTLTLMTVAETGDFSTRAALLLGDQEKLKVIDYLSDNPEAGVLIRGSGGVRKLRWTRPGSGKSGGVRIIYYFHSAEIPLWLLTLFAKNEKADLSDEEVKNLSRFVSALKETLKGTSKKV